MLTVHKFPIPIADYSTIDMPERAKILSVDIQYDKPMMWALVDTTAPFEQRHFRFAGTGHALQENVVFIGSLHMYNGALIFHVFELISMA